MNEYLIRKNTLTEIGNKVRRLSGDDEALSPVEMAEGLENVANEVDTQSDLIQQIKTVLADKASGVELPTLENPGTASDLAEGKQLIDADGNVVTGNIWVLESNKGTDLSSNPNSYPQYIESSKIFRFSDDMHHNYLCREGSTICVIKNGAVFGNATAADVAKGVTFTSENGLKVTGTATIGGGSTIKSGTTTNRVIDTGLSDIEQFFIYKETQTATGLIHLHYTKSATSRMYASAWSTSSYGTKTVTNGTGGVTVSGGTLTISATQAAQGALTSGVTYKWVAIGKE